MAVVRPFKAVRPAADLAERVVSLPYDVMNRAEAAEMAKDNPVSFLHISRAEIDLPEETDPYCAAVYERGRDNIASFQKMGVLIEEERPALYIYRQEMDGRFQTGIVGCCSIDEYDSNIIKKHELTRYDKEIDRICHFDICSADTEPVFLTYRNREELDRMVHEFMENHRPAYDFYTNDGIGHTLWVVDDEALIGKICRAFDHVPELYIADGHHRSASACEVGKKRREAHPDYTGEEEFNYFMAVIYPESDLKIFDYNRVVKDLNGNTAEAFLAKLEEAGFDVSDQGTELCRPQKLHQFTMYLDGHWYRLDARPEIIPEDAVGALDVSVLQNNVLAPLLGIEDPRKDQRIDFVGGIRGLSELQRRAEDDMRLAFAVYPMTVEELMHIADCGRIMPPKSTWFEPKPGSGLFLHKFE